MQHQKACVFFSLCREMFGIDVINVLRVINLDRIMKIPKAPDFIVGAITLEGNVIPVVDLAKKIELGETSVTVNTKVIVLEIHHRDNMFMVGIMIDNVLDVATIELSKMIPPTLENMGFETNSLDGLIRIDADHYMILNASKIFEKEISALS
jgi:purine-binding chemotaxis protein CheW